MPKKLDWEKARRNPLGYEQAEPSTGNGDRVAEIRRLANTLKPLVKKTRAKAPAGFKRCDRCKLFKAHDRFGLDPAQGRRLSTCRTCLRLFYQYRKGFPDERRAWAQVVEWSRIEYEKSQGASDKPRGRY